MSIAIAFLIVPLLVSAAVVSYLLRHWGLALLVMLAPAPGCIAALAIYTVGWSTGPEPFLFCALVAGGLAIDEFVLARSGGDNKSAMQSANRTISVLLVTIVVWGLFRFAQHGVTVSSALTALRGIVTFFLVFLSTVSVLQLCRLLPFSEDFIARTNRFRERGERYIDRVLLVAQPRWAFAMTGVALVLATTIAFRFGGAVTVGVSDTPAWFLIYVLAAVFLLFLARDWRLMLAGTIGLSNILIFGLPDLYIRPLSVFFITYIVFRISVYRRAGDEMSLAVPRALARSGLGVALLSLMIVLAMSSAIIGGSLVDFDGVLSLRPIIAGISDMLTALVFVPAFAVAIETLFPRRETLEARYRVH